MSQAPSTPYASGTAFMSLQQPPLWAVSVWPGRVLGSAGPGQLLGQANLEGCSLLDHNITV